LLLSFKATESWNTDYFVEIAGTLDPLIPSDAVDAWNSELASYGGDFLVDELEGAYHGFSIKYSQAFYQFLSLAFANGQGLITGDDGLYVGVEGVILWTQETQDYSFNKIYEAFGEAGLMGTSGLMEYEHIYYNAAGEEMVGYFIYENSEETMRPGLVMFDGPWGGNYGQQNFHLEIILTLNKTRENILLPFAKHTPDLGCDYYFQFGSLHFRIIRFYTK